MPFFAVLATLQRGKVSKVCETPFSIPATAKTSALNYAPQQDMVIEDIKETIDLSAQNNLVGLAAEAQAKDVKTNVGLDFIPKEGAELSWDPGELSIRFEMDKLNFDWRMTQGQFEFTPGDIEISVTQRPDVLITYVGGPIYVPRSSDPNYDPIDTHA